MFLPRIQNQRPVPLFPQPALSYCRLLATENQAAIVPTKAKIIRHDMGQRPFLTDANKVATGPRIGLSHVQVTGYKTGL